MIQIWVGFTHLENSSFRGIAGSSAQLLCLSAILFIQEVYGEKKQPQMQGSPPLASFFFWILVLKILPALIACQCPQTVHFA